MSTVSHSNDSGAAGGRPIETRRSDGSGSSPRCHRCRCLRKGCRRLVGAWSEGTASVAALPPPEGLEKEAVPRRLAKTPHRKALLDTTLRLLHVARRYAGSCVG